MKADDEMPEKIPDEIIIKDLLRIKRENEAYIQELEEEKRNAKAFTPPNPYKKQLKANEKTIQKHKDKILELQGEIVDYKRRMDNLRERLGMDISEQLKYMTPGERMELAMLEGYCQCCGIDENENGKCYCCQQYDE